MTAQGAPGTTNRGTIVKSREVAISETGFRRFPVTENPVFQELASRTSAYWHEDYGNFTKHT